MKYKVIQRRLIQVARPIEQYNTVQYRYTSNHALYRKSFQLRYSIGGYEV